jgi:hypothetical protein
MVPERTHLSKLNPVKLLWFILEVAKEQGYIDADGFLTPLGGEYLAAMTSDDVPLPAETQDAKAVRDLQAQLNTCRTRLHDVDKNAPANLDEIADKDFRWALQAAREFLTPYDERPGNLRP